MTLSCEESRDRLADGVTDAALESHLHGCASCRSLAAALGEIDGELRALAPIDAPSSLVEATLARVAREAVRDEEVAATEAPAVDGVIGRVEPRVRERGPLETPPTKTRAPMSKQERLEVEGGSLVTASFAVLVAALTALLMAPLMIVRAIGAFLTSSRDSRASASRNAASPGGAASRDVGTPRVRRRTPWLEMGIVASIAGVVGVAGWQRFGNMVKGKIDGSTNTLDAYPTESSEGGRYRSGGWFEDDAEESAPSAAPAAAAPSPAEPTVHRRETGGAFAEPIEAVGARPQSGSRGRGSLNAPTGVASQVANGRTPMDQTGESLFAQRELSARAVGQPGSTELMANQDGAQFETGLRGADQRGAGQRDLSEQGRQDRDGVLEQGLAGRDTTLRGGEDSEGDGREREATIAAISPEIRAQLRALGYAHAEPDDDANEAVNGFDTDDLRRPSAWRQSQATTGLTLRPRDGWWQSTYIPGDPAIRLVHARLAASTANLPALGGTGLAFAQDVDALEPMLDAPRDRALAVAAFADAAAIDGPTRVRVEVALRSVARSSGRRGALRVAVVIDADVALDASAQARTRAIVNALSRSSSSRDQLALYASGAHGGELTALGPMRAGRLEVALRRLFAGQASAPTETTVVQGPVSVSTFVPVSRVVTDALEAVSGADSVGLVLVLTPDSANDAETERAIHLGTVAGITTSAIGVSASTSLAGLDAIALAGQGRRRIVLSDEDALASVRAELSAASELVARAVRVRVRLAEGVDLVDVIGSRPLDAEESQRTRQVEQSIDQDLARRLGILSDRDDDQDGIRMLIPAFYANDAHTIVLDLLVRQPGRVLDVDVALKDLVRVGNARASASLTLPSGRRERGPRELRVVTDSLAHTSALALLSASDALAMRDVAAARATLSNAHALFVSAAAEQPSLARSPSFVADRARLEACVNALDQPGDRSLLGDVARLAAYRRLLHPRLAVVP